MIHKVLQININEVVLTNNFQNRAEKGRSPLRQKFTYQNYVMPGPQQSQQKYCFLKVQKLVRSSLSMSLSAYRISRYILIKFPVFGSRLFYYETCFWRWLSCGLTTRCNKQEESLIFIDKYNDPSNADDEIQGLTHDY